MVRRGYRFRLVEPWQLAPPLNDQRSRSCGDSDGFGGGNELYDNVLFNTCRESSDHGAFNSWDRLPYVTDIRDGSTPSTVPAFNEAHHNLIVSNYGADGGCLDNDDGSSYYRIHHNVCFYGGHKSDFDGHDKLSCAPRDVLRLHHPSLARPGQLRERVPPYTHSCARPSACAVTKIFTSCRRSTV